MPAAPNASGCFRPGPKCFATVIAGILLIGNANAVVAQQLGSTSGQQQTAATGQGTQVGAPTGGTGGFGTAALGGSGQTGTIGTVGQAQALGQSGFVGRGAAGSGLVGVGGNTTGGGRQSNANRFGAGGRGGGGQQTGGTSTSSRYTSRPRLRVGFTYPAPSATTLTGTVRTGLANIASRRSSLAGVNVAAASGGTVVLRGMVDSADARRLAANLARLEPGVRSVQNEIKVQGTGGAAQNQPTQ